MPRSAYNGTCGALGAVGYVRVSTQEQSSSGAGLEAQRQAITAEAKRRGWNLVAIFEDAGLSGKNLNRPGLEQALATVKNGQANAIVVAKLDRLSRSLVDFASLLADAKRHGYNVVALDLGVDLSTPAGEFLASVMASAAQWERRIIGQRTRDALAVKRAQGLRLGRPREMSTDAIKRIHELRESGLTVAAIARQLDAERCQHPRREVGIPRRQPGASVGSSRLAAVADSPDLARAFREPHSTRTGQDDGPPCTAGKYGPENLQNLSAVRGENRTFRERSTPRERPCPRRRSLGWLVTGVTGSCSRSRRGRCGG